MAELNILGYELFNPVKREIGGKTILIKQGYCDVGEGEEGFYTVMVTERGSSWDIPVRGMLRLGEKEDVLRRLERGEDPRKIANKYAVLK